MHGNETSLIPSLRDSILMPLSDPVKDIGEIMIDSVFEDGIFRDIPIIGTIAGLAKVGICLRERNLAKNTYAFIMGFRNQLINEQQKEKYRKRMEDSMNAEKELGYALILLDKESQVAKAELYGKAYRLFVKESISWDKFVELSEAISRMFMIDFNHLERLATGLPLRAGVKEEELYGFQRLKGLGLIEEENISFAQTSLVFKKEFRLTSFGNAFVGLVQSE